MDLIDNGVKEILNVKRLVPIPNVVFGDIQRFLW